MGDIYHGGCQCGAIRYELMGAALQVIACHCTDCQRQSGSAFGMTMVVAEADFRLTHGKVNTFTLKSDAGRTKLGGFCPQCGTRMYNKTDWRPGMIAVKPGTLDETGSLQPQIHLWTRNKQGWVVIPDGVEVYETQPA
ncbi:MAG: GFA family protein [SAR324 cluster bacterium]|nr:GFA family protein [SAR324 cluster bacterium]